MTLFCRIWCLLALLAAFIAAHPHRAAAEILPTKGTFSGIYHENRAGVGRFKFFLVAPKLKKQLAQYDGKHIELEVLSGRQPINPGPAIMEEIGRIKELPPAPLAIDIKTVVPGAGGPKTFDVVYSFQNTGKETIELYANDVAIGIQGYGRKVDNPTEVDHVFGAGYTRYQLSYGRGYPTQPWNFISTMSLGGGQRTHFYTRRVQIQPGEAAPFVWQGLLNQPKEVELVVSAYYYPPDEKESIPLQVWKPLDLPLPPDDDRKADSGLAVRATVTRQEEWLTVEGRLVNETDKPRHIFVQPDGERFFLSGVVQLFDKNGKSLGLDLNWQDPHELWVRKAIDKEGLPFRFRLRQSNHFSTIQEHRIAFWTLTHAGLEQFTVAQDLPARPVLAEPPWGETVSGCRSRIRLAKDQFAETEPIRFVFQAESDRTAADILWIDPGNASVLVDGKRVASGLLEKHVLSFPRQHEIKLPVGLKLAPGKHTLQVRATGTGGVYTNLNNVEFRKFEGTLISNEAEFEVK